MENGLVDTVGELKSEINRESSIDIYIQPCAKQIASENLLYNTESQPGALMIQRDGIGGGEGGNICIIMADLHCCMAETITTL